VGGGLAGRGSAGGHIVNYVPVIYEPSDAGWNSTVRDLTDGEWAYIADLIPEYSGPGKIGRPVKWNKRDIVDAILYVVGTGCQWRALPDRYPRWKTVWDYHARWSRDGVWEQICDHLRALVREREGREVEASAAIVDARSVQGAATVTSETRGYDAAKKVSGRKVFAIVDTVGLLMAVIVVAANVSDNAGGSACAALAAPKSRRLTKIWCDQGFKVEFAKFCRTLGIKAEAVKRTATNGFEVLPRRWVVERSFAWLVNNRRLRTDYERDPVVTAGMVWAAQTRLLLRRLTRDHEIPARAG
jgi:transposase